MKVVLNTTVDEKLISAEKPDSIILATGARPMAPPIKGAEQPHVVQAWDVLQDKVYTGKRVAIIGGGYMGLWTAYYLSQQQPDLDIAVFEAVTVGFGASGRNGGWCMGLAWGIEEMLADPARRQPGVDLLGNHLRLLERADRGAAAHAVALADRAVGVGHSDQAVAGFLGGLDALEHLRGRELVAVHLAKDHVVEAVEADDQPVELGQEWFKVKLV